MKDKKRLLLIGSIILILVLGVAVYFGFAKNDKPDLPSKEKFEGNVVAPADNTEQLIQEVPVIETATITEDEIVFSNDIKLENKQKVAVWIYSEPKFLGYFDVVEQNGVKMIKGLKEAMKEIRIEPGNHNIAIVTKEGDSVGYVGVYVEENKIYEDEQTAIESKYITKEITEKSEVKYQTETKRDANKKSGSREVTQKGVNGEIEITYKVTYDETGKEISRKKLSERTIKEVTNEIVVIGSADYNVNSSKITNEFIGFMCSESQTMTYDGQIFCNDSLELPSFKVIAIDRGSLKVVTLNEVAVTPIPVTKKDNLYIGKYKGETHYFEVRGGGGNPDGEPLTLELCKEYNLSCGAW